MLSPGRDGPRPPVTRHAPPTGGIGPATERIQSLDVLRGLALFGMIVVHFHVHTLETTSLDELIRTFVWRFVEEKSHGTFALLFGAGFAIQLRRSEARGAPFAGRYLRRLGVLALFGLIAHAGFGYNVLLGYAAWGVPLLVIRRWSTRALIITAILLTVTLASYHLLAHQYDRLTLGSEGAQAAVETRRATAREVNDALDAAEAGSSYRQVLAARLDHMAWFYAQPFSFVPGATLALFIAGLLFARHRIFEHPDRHRRVVIGMMIFGLVSWITDNWLPIPTLGLLRNQWLTFTYVGAFLLVVAGRAAWMARLRPIALAGRMALTNYLFQIAVLDLLFSGYGLGWGTIRPVLGLAASGLLFGVEVALSMMWFTRYRIGPAEWIWRSLTYGSAQALRR
jgi:uncharacterized protein